MRSFGKVCIAVGILSCFFTIALADSSGIASYVANYGKSILQFPKFSEVNLKSMSLLDPSRFTMKQATIMNYSSSGMYGSNLMGMYLNTMEYRFNMPLTMRLRVAYQNNMGGIFSNKNAAGGRPGVETGRLYIPSFDLVYQPWKNTIISFHYRDFSGMDSYYSPYSRYQYMYSPFMRY